MFPLALTPFARCSAALCAMLAVAGAAASESAPSAGGGSGACRNGLFVAEALAAQPALARVSAGSPRELHFHRDDDGCPGAGESRCRSVAYVLPGDELIVARETAGWSCVWYHGAKRETVGWVRSARLERAASPGDLDWRGRWRSRPGHAELRISGGSGTGELNLIGSAAWRGGTAAMPVVHEGELRGAIRPAATRAVLGDASRPGACSAQLLRLGRYLLVHDNGACGGANVRFDGVYTSN